MKKLIMAIVCLMTMMMGFTSCGNSPVSKARDNYKKSITKNAKDHDVDVTFNGETILINKKDLAVIEVTANASDKYGKYVIKKFISVCAIDDEGNIGTAIDTKENWEKLIDMALALSKMEAHTESFKKVSSLYSNEEDVYRHTALKDVNWDKYSSF